MSAEEKLKEAKRILTEWLDVDMKNYEEPQYGKSKIRRLISLLNEK